MADCHTDRVISGCSLQIEVRLSETHLAIIGLTSGQYCDVGVSDAHTAFYGRFGDAVSILSFWRCCFIIRCGTPFLHDYAFRHVGHPVSHSTSTYRNTEPIRHVDGLRSVPTHQDICDYVLADALGHPQTANLVVLTLIEPCEMVISNYL